MKIKKKYTISISIMLVSTLLLWIGKLDSSDWVTVILGVSATITAGYIARNKYGKD